MIINERVEKGRDQWDNKHLKQSQNPSILQTLATAILIHSLATLNDKTMTHIIIFTIHIIIHELSAYLDQFSKQEGNLVDLEWFCRRQLEWSRPCSEWSRTEPEWSRTFTALFEGLPGVGIGRRMARWKGL